MMMTTVWNFFSKKTDLMHFLYERVYVATEFSRIGEIRVALGGCRDIFPCRFMGFAHKVRQLNNKGVKQWQKG
jgi:hypothetical protein